MPASKELGGKSRARSNDYQAHTGSIKSLILEKRQIASQRATGAYGNTISADHKKCGYSCEKLMMAAFLFYGNEILKSDS
jgi:hypothetical protein